MRNIININEEWRYKKNKAKAGEIKAKACITTPELQGLIPEGVIVLVTDNPKLCFINLLNAFYAENKPCAKIEDSAHISKTAKIGIVTQTTLSIDDTKDIMLFLRNRFSNIVNYSKINICFAKIIIW